MNGHHVVTTGTRTAPFRRLPHPAARPIALPIVSTKPSQITWPMPTDSTPVAPIVPHVQRGTRPEYDLRGGSGCDAASRACRELGQRDASMGVGGWLPIVPTTSPFPSLAHPSFMAPKQTMEGGLT